MFVKRRELATVLQPGEHHRCLAYWARQLPVNIPPTEYAIRQEVMHRILVPHMHCEVLLCSSVVRQHPLFPSMLQFIPQWLHEHTHIVARVFRYYQRQEHVLGFKHNAGGKIEGYHEHGPTSVRSHHHSIRVEPINCQCYMYIPSVLCFLRMLVIEVLPCITIRWVYHVATVSFAILVPSHLFRGLLCHIQPLEP